MLEELSQKNCRSLYSIEDDQHHLLPYLLQLSTNLSTEKVVKWV